MDTAHGDDDRDLPSTLPGTVIAGKYRIDGLIGRGGMGSVWSALHIGLGQRVAVKLIAKRYVTSREARLRFDLEAKAVAQLRSRFVVQIYDNGETADGIPYIVMELLDGESLDQRIQRGTIPLDQTVRILAQVARALARAHSLGIVHRDLKPENIFLTRTDDDDGEIAKVLDFGIAKIKQPEGSDSATRTGTVLGTPLFMSPEQARGLKSVDHRTDIYSLGMVAYMMLTGQSAFSGESFGDILVAICTQPLPSLQKMAPYLPPAMDAWLNRTCAREPGERYASIEQMLEGLYTAAGIGRPKAQELMRGDSAGTAQIPPRVDHTQGSPMQAASTPGTTSALTVTGDDIPKRAVLGPVLFTIGGVAAAGVAAFIFLRKPAEGDTTGSSNAATLVAPSPALSASAAAPAPSAVPAAPQASAAEASSRPVQKVAPPAKPPGKMPAEVTKAPPKAPPPQPPKSKPPTDLGF